VKPLIVDPKELRPLTPAMWGMSCFMCDRRQSRWEYVSPEQPARSKHGEPVCSLCWIYDSEWALTRSVDIESMICAVEIEAGEVFKRAEERRLWSCTDADRILMSIVVTSRIWTFQNMMAGLEVSDES